MPKSCLFEPSHAYRGTLLASFSLLLRKRTIILTKGSNFYFEFIAYHVWGYTA